MTGNHGTFMARAIELSERTSLVEGAGAPFGAVVVQDRTILAEGANRAAAENDPTWHAEIEAIRNACRAAGMVTLRDAVLYASGEPCAMCMAAAHWAGIKEIYYASTYDDIAAYGDFGGGEKGAAGGDSIPTHQMMRAEAVAVWKKYRDRIR
jgi:tRNA(Arg) A34 adenosine deaminase TadA